LAEFMDGPPDFNQAQLIERGWTRTAIRRILGEPDRRIADQAFAETKYLASRVYSAEQAGATRYRREKRLLLKRRRVIVPRRWFPRGPDLPLHALDPSDWLPKVKLYDLHVDIPWTVERLIFTSDDGVLHVSAHHQSGVRWACLKCGRRCPNYDHRPERVWFTSHLEMVPCVLRGRLPRYFCPSHGVHTVPPLADFLDADRLKPPQKGPLVWVIRPCL
jgi:hypothetical protein